MLKFLQVTLLSLVACSSVVQAQITLLVPQQFPNIQQAIVAANSGDTILVGPGSYQGFDTLGRAVTIRSSHGPGFTEIRPQLLPNLEAPNAAIRIVSGEQTSTVIEGFAVRGGDFPPLPQISRGFRIAASNPIIRDCLIEGHWAGDGRDGFVVYPGTPEAAQPGYDGAGALVIAGASPRFEDCTFNRNRAGAGGVCPMLGFGGQTSCIGPYGAPGRGAGVAVYSAAVVLQDCRFFDHGNGAAVGVPAGGFAVLRDCELRGNARTLWVLDSGRINAQRCRFQNSSFSTLAGDDHDFLSCLFAAQDFQWTRNLTLDHCTVVDSTSPLDLQGTSCARNSIFWNSLTVLDPSQGYSEWANWDPATVVESCLFRGAAHPGIGNITAADAGFVDAALADYHLRWDSPAVNAGQTGVISPNNTDIDGQPRRLGSGFDMGADEAVCVGLGRLEDPMASAETLDLAWFEGQTSTPLAGELLGSGAEAGVQGVAALSLAPGMTTSGAVTLHLDANNVLAVFINFDANGEFRLPLDVGDPSLAGAVVYMQVFAAESTGTSSSNGLEVTFCD